MKPRDPNDLFAQVGALIRPAWHYPEITRGRIVFDSHEHASEPFEATRWKQTADIVVEGRPRGVVEVYYLEERPELDEGPFLKEERALIESIANMLGVAIGRIESETKLKKKTVELEAANSELESFAYSISHDLRAPLRAIDGFSKAVLEDYGDKLNDIGKGYLNRVRAGTQRMGKLIDDLLQLSRLSRVETRKVEVDLTSMARSIVEQLEATEPERTVEVEMAPNLMVMGDSTLIESVLQNLLLNAWKFTSGKDVAEIEVGVIETDGERVFFVRDNGAGFDMAYADKLFGVFQRLHNTEEFPGTGVGLATVQRVINRHGGRVWGEGAVDHGATFYFTLPTQDSEKGE